MTAPHDLVHQATRLTRLYILALSAVACFSILGQVLVQWSLSRQQSDSTVVNLAGRQRMLSQRLVKAALKLQQNQHPEQLAATREEIVQTLAEWRQADLGLRRGDTGLGLPGRNSPALQQMLSAIEPHFDAMSDAADRLLTTTVANSVELETLLSHEPRFLVAMDAIVQQYECEARQRVTWLRLIERGLLVLTLLVLVCEGVVIFRPAIDRLRLAAISMGESQHELEIAKEQADSANAAKSQFLATISHELRNPLQAILGSVELGAKTTTEPQSLEHLETISTAARTLLTLLNDLLDLARIEAGKLAIVNAPLDPVRLTQRTLAMVKPQASALGLQLNCQYHNPPAICSGDEIRIQQVLLNLLTNALKFSPTGSINVRVSALDEKGTLPRLRWEVRDTGIGIAKSDQQTIFTPFRQFAPTAASKGGAGLGLAICHRLIGLMQGQIGVESQPGSGSLFWFELPLAQPVDAEIPITEATTNSLAASTLRVLIVDDDPVNRRLLAQMLETLSHRIVSAGTGQEALTLFRNSPFDLAILDWQLPDMHGGQLATSLRSLEAELSRPRIPLIALSAAIKSTCSEAESISTFDQWLTKPIGLADLASALGRRPPPPTNTQPPDDRWTTTLARLGNRRDLLTQIANSYCTGLPNLLADLQAASSENRHSEVARIAHLLAGQASCFSAHKLAATAQFAEATALQGSLEPSLLIQLEKQSQELVTELNDWFSPDFDSQSLRSSRPLAPLR